MRVALGAICAQFLEALGITTTAHVSQIGSVVARDIADVDEERTNASEVRCPDPESERAMIAAIDAAKAAGDTLGGTFTVRVAGVPVGVGSNRQPDTRLDGILAGALMAMQTVKAVEVGAGRDVASLPGSGAHDVFTLEDGNVARGSNRAGGIEGGISNGQDIVLRVSVKPIPTLMKALPSVNLHEGAAAPASIVRSDVCVVPAASIVGEAMVRLALTAPILEKFGGDSIDETRENLERAVAASARLFEPSRGAGRSTSLSSVSWRRGRRRSAVTSHANSTFRSSIRTKRSCAHTGRSPTSSRHAAKERSATRNSRP